MYSLEQRKEPKLKAKMYPPVTPVLGAKNEKYSSEIQTYGHQTYVLNGTEARFYYEVLSTITKDTGLKSVRILLEIQKYLHLNGVIGPCWFWKQQRYIR